MLFFIIPILLPTGSKIFCSLKDHAYNKGVNNNKGVRNGGSEENQASYQNY